LLKEFLERYPELRVEIEPSELGSGAASDVDVFFKLLAPKDSLRRVRPCQGRYEGFSRAQPISKSPETRRLWTLEVERRQKKMVTPPTLFFRVGTSDPTVALKLAIAGFGIAILPLWMAKSRTFEKPWCRLCRNGFLSRLLSARYSRAHHG
jgi:DNA-binding transcriptional LysR family regulator